jgi:hypothetical protein
MMLGAATFALSVALAAVVGFAAARGGICAVQAIEGVVTGRGPELFVGFLKCSVWVLTVTLALAWTLVPDARLAFGYPLGWKAAVGGFVFGLGAAANGGCAFSTASASAFSCTASGSPRCCPGAPCPRASSRARNPGPWSFFSRRRPGRRGSGPRPPRWSRSILRPWSRAPR